MDLFWNIGSLVRTIPDAFSFHLGPQGQKDYPPYAAPLVFSPDGGTVASGKAYSRRRHARRGRRKYLKPKALKMPARAVGLESVLGAGVRAFKSPRPTNRINEIRPPFGGRSSSYNFYYKSRGIPRH